MNSSLQLCLNQLLRNVRAAGNSRNAVVSPVSLRAAVAMLGAGCSGRSLDQVLQFFGFENSAELIPSFSRSTGILNRAQVPCVNGAWIDERRSFKPSYEECLTDTFKAKPKTQDFVNRADEAVRDINSWADCHTKGFTGGIIKHIDPWTSAILGNALYFKGCWKEAFFTTENRDFYLENGEKVSDVTFMNALLPRNDMGPKSFDDFKMMDIPYENRLTMRFVLPEKRDGLKDVLEKLVADPELLDSGTAWHPDTEFWIPKFKFSYTIDDINLGSGKTDVGEMLLGEELGVVRVVQKVGIEVDEKGAEAAAAKGKSHRKEDFVGDHPFMFIIRETLNGVVLFAGTVMNPLQDAHDSLQFSG